MPVSFFTEDVKCPLIKKREIVKWIKNVATSYGKKVGIITYIFCSDAKILEINRQYLQHDYYTDIITFDYSEDDNIAGDLFISIDTVRSNSEKFNTNFEVELRRVIIHGILHLCGLDDKGEANEQRMREAEEEALQLYRKE
ncbi:MAG: rRNA maturation RNase YbeY [Tannerella sp.]|jgi:rRNA maturation RNase YbeY|nr:rRNA maturation RNase YbeY [Tannerella sp.]